MYAAGPGRHHHRQALQAEDGRRQTGLADTLIDGQAASDA